MSKMMLDLHIRTSVENLNTILGVIDGTAELLKMEQAKVQRSSSHATAPTIPRKHRADGKNGIEHAIDFFKAKGVNAKFDLSHLGTYLVSKGFNRNSGAGILSRTKKAGFVHSLGHGQWQVVKTT